MNFKRHLEHKTLGYTRFSKHSPKCNATTHEAWEKIGKQAVSSISWKEPETNINDNTTANADANSSGNSNRNK